LHSSSEQLIIFNGCMDAIQTALEITTNVGGAALGTEPLGSAFVVFQNECIDEKGIKFMINTFKGNIGTHKAVVMTIE
jgi:hypothetical protein